MWAKLNWLRPNLGPRAAPGTKMKGGTFRALRHQLRKSQSELADELNRRLGRSYDRPKLSKWESGRDPIPDDVANATEALIGIQPRNARVLALANQKGGVGKTTSSLNLAYALVRLGQRVLLLDLDPQATATSVLFGQAAIELFRQRRTVAHVILDDCAISDAIVRGGETVEGRSAPFDFIGSHINLAGVDMRREPGFDAALQDSLEGLRRSYDFVVIDAPPNLGTLTWMALGAADLVIIPVQTEPYDAMGVSMILDTIRRVQRRLNSSLRIAGILPTRFSANLTIDREVLNHLVTVMADIAPVIEPVPNSTVYSHAAWASRITLEASPTSKVVQVYVRLATAMVQGQPLPRALQAAAASLGIPVHSEIA